MTNSSSRRALVVQNNFSPFGNKLVQSGFVDSGQMQKALIESRKSGRSLTDVLQDIAGKSLSPDLLRQYKKQQLFELKILYGVESLDPEIGDIPAQNVSQLIDTLIPIDICRRYYLLPLSKDEENHPPSVLIAMVDPDNLEAQDELKRILRPQGLQLQRMVITQEDYQQIISKCLDEQAARQKQMERAQAVDVASDLEGLEGLDSLEDVADEMEADLGEVIKGADDAPIIALVNKILAKALQEGVSDIHIEPQEESLRVRFRKDGVLLPAFNNEFPKKIIPSVTARFKIISNLDISERRLPQDGRIRRRFEGRKIDFRVNTLPSRYGEKIVLRILDNSSTQLGLDKLISDPSSLELVRGMASRPFGLLLVTGPTGSGKTTTLYSVLQERNDPGINISTAEDPIEYTLPGLTQVQVIREKGMDFASILRAFLRQDPDVILVGETRDRETAKTAIEAALTGHLVLTTLHTNDAASAIARLDEMGVESFMVSSSLLGVLAQRLVRRVCDECRIEYQPTKEELAHFGLQASSEGDSIAYKANKLTAAEIQAARDAGTLCKKCGGVGYKGRCGVYEIMKVDPELQTLITKGAPTEMIKGKAVENGMKTLLAYGLELVWQGATTLDEIDRVILSDSGSGGDDDNKETQNTVLSCHVCHASLQPEWMVCPYCTTPRRFSDN